MRKKFLILISLFIFVCNCCVISTDALSASSAIVIEASTGKVIFSKNGEKRMKPASTTKILTALCALDYGNLEDIVKISQKAANEEGSSMYIEAGEKIKMENLIYGLMLNSGNDAAVAIAEHISGSEEEFSKLMNKKARECGVKNSNFENPNGLDSDKHYVTAYDLALITKKALENEKFRDIVKTRTKIVATESGVKKYLTNHNKMLAMYKDCIGVKTGFTKASGRTLVTAAEKNGVEIIAVTLNAPDDWNDHRNLLDIGFANAEEITVLTKGKTVGTAEVKNGISKKCSLVCKDGYKYIKIKNSNEKIDVKYSIGRVKAPVMKNEKIGKCYIYLNGKKIFETELLAAETIDGIKKENKFTDIFKRFFEL